MPNRFTVQYDDGSIIDLGLKVQYHPDRAGLLAEGDKIRLERSMPKADPVALVRQIEYQGPGETIWYRPVGRGLTVAEPELIVYAWLIDKAGQAWLLTRSAGASLPTLYSMTASPNDALTEEELAASWRGPLRRGPAVRAR